VDGEGEHKAEDRHVVAEDTEKLSQMKSVLEKSRFSGLSLYSEHGTQLPPTRMRCCYVRVLCVCVCVGINRKAQVKRVNADSVLIILKWGGVLTHSGARQAEELGRVFRSTMYPGELESLGLLRLHSTYRHDLKIYSSDEGRVLMTAAAFAKGLLDLEGELTPILASLVRAFNTNSMLDDTLTARDIMDDMKRRLRVAVTRQFSALSAPSSSAALTAIAGRANDASGSMAAASPASLMSHSSSAPALASSSSSSPPTATASVTSASAPAPASASAAASAAAAAAAATGAASGGAGGGTTGVGIGAAVAGTPPVVSTAAEVMTRRVPSGDTPATTPPPRLLAVPTFEDLVESVIPTRDVSALQCLEVCVDAVTVCSLLLLRLSVPLKLRACRVLR
jgi:hypothetical protein